MNMNTKREVHAALEIVMAVAEAIRELGETPSGHLYANLMSSGMTLQAYNSIIETLKRAGLVEERASHMLVWVGGGK